MDAKLKAITDAAAKVIDAYVDKHGKEVVMSKVEQRVAALGSLLQPLQQGVDRI